MENTPSSSNQPLSREPISREPISGEPISREPRLPVSEDVEAGPGPRHSRIFGAPINALSDGFRAAPGTGDRGSHSLVEGSSFGSACSALRAAVLTDIPAPDIRTTLRDEFEFLKQSSYRGVPGVLCIDSGRPGPSIGIGISTHGNEPSGLAASWYCRKENFLAQRLESGRVLFMLQNVAATERYFATPATDMIALHKCRLNDINFNRLPADALERDPASASEIRRLHELYPVYRELGYGLDIHSTTGISTPMIIEVSGDALQLMRGMPIETLLRGVVGVQIGKPASHFFGGVDAEIPVIGIETGCHEQPEALQRSIQCTMAFLANVGVLGSNVTTSPRAFTVFDIYGSLIHENAGMKLMRSTTGFEAVSQGELIAQSAEKDYRCPEDGHVVLGPPTIEIVPLGEEVLFYSRPKRREVL